MKATGVLFILIFSLMGCKSSTPVTSNDSHTVEPKTELDKSKPQAERTKTVPVWVTQKPQSDAYYYGIGRAPLSADDYLGSAKKEALADLASEIKVNISSSSFLFQEEDRYGFAEQYRSLITSGTEMALENYELAGSWSDGVNYWVFYSLSKSEYLRQKNEKKQKAVAIAADYFLRGQSAVSEKAYGEAMSYCIQGLDALEYYLGDDTRVLLNDGKQVNLAGEIFSTLQYLISHCSLSGPGTVHVRAKGAAQYSTSFTVYFQDDTTNGIVRNLPVHFFNSQQDLRFLTDASGRIEVSGNKLMSLGQNIKAGIDMETFLPGSSAVTKRLLQRIRVPEKHLLVNIRPVTAFIITEEYNLNKRLQGSVLKPMLQEVLHTRGVNFTDSLADADILIKLKADTRKGAALSGLYSAFLDITVSAKDLSADKEIYGDHLTNIKGIKLSFEDAGIEAYHAAKKEFEDQLADRLIQTIIK